MKGEGEFDALAGHPVRQAWQKLQTTFSMRQTHLLTHLCHLLFLNMVLGEAHPPFLAKVWFLGFQQIGILSVAMVTMTCWGTTARWRQYFNTYLLISCMSVRVCDCEKVREGVCECQRE